MDGIFIFIIIYLLLFIFLAFEKTKQFINQFLSEIFTAISAFGMTYIDIMSESNEKFVDKYSWSESWKFLIGFFLIQILIGLIVSAIRNKNNLDKRSLEIENKKLSDSIDLIKQEYYKLCSNSILNMFNTFYSDGQERISIYKHQGSDFVLLGRCSRSPEYNRSTSYHYNEKEGFIGIGWEKGEFFCDGVPRWSGNGMEYKKFMIEKCNISDVRLNQIRMKSRSFYVKNLNDESTATNPDGIIVFESMNPTKVNKTECDALIKKNQKALLSLLKNMKSLTSKVSRIKPE